MSLRLTIPPEGPDFQRLKQADIPDMITLNQPPLTQHVSVPKDMTDLSVEAFTAGIVEGVLDGLDMVSARFHCTDPSSISHHSKMRLTISPQE